MPSSLRLLVLLSLASPGCIIYADDKLGDTGVSAPSGDGSEPDTDPMGPDTGDTGDDLPDTGAPLLDEDGDGHLAPDDCDDTNPAIHPGAEEICDDGVDNNCDGGAPDCRLTEEQDALDVADTVFQGAASEDRFGASLSTAGDVNGDGLPDVLIAARGAPGGASAVHLFLSPTSGFVNAGAADATLVSALGLDGLGASIAPLGDLDGDGYDDFALSAPQAADLAVEPLAAQAVSIFSGPLAGTATTLTADAWLPPLEIGDGAGARLGAPGDLTGDGVADLLIAAPGASVTSGDLAGKVYLMEGPWRREESLNDAVATFTGDGAGARAGLGAAGGAGDIDGDGQADLLITSPDAPAGGDPGRGAAWLVTRGASGLVDLAYADVRISGLSQGDGFGASAVALGDLDADGYDDVLIGAPGADLGAVDAGAAFVFSGGPALSGALDAGDADFLMLGVLTGAGAGAAVGAPGDLDGDGRADLAVGDPLGLDAAGRGAVGLMYGPVAGTTDLEDADLIVIGTTAGAGVGLALAGAGDTDGDGLGELLFGAELTSPSGLITAGAAYLVRGRGR
jgi:hypothetical protein